MAAPLLVALVCADAASRPTGPFPNGTLLIQRDTRKLLYWNGGVWLNAATGA